MVYLLQKLLRFFTMLRSEIFLREEHNVKYYSKVFDQGNPLV